MMTNSCLILLISCSLLHSVVADVTANLDSATVDAETPICIDVLSNDVYTGGVTVSVVNSTNGFAFVNYPPFFMMTRDFDAVIEAENYQLINYRGQPTYSTGWNPAYWEVVVGQYSNLIGNGIRIWPNIMRDSGAGNTITGPAVRYDVAFRASNPNYRAYARGQTCIGSNNATINNSCKTPDNDDSVGFMYAANASYTVENRINGFPAGNSSCDWKEFPRGFPIDPTQYGWPPVITPVWIAAVADGVVIDRIYLSLKTGLETELAGDIPATQFVKCNSKEILYFPALGFAGFDSVPYTITDGVSSSTGYVDINVIAVSPSPTASITPTRTPSRTPTPGSPSTTPTRSSSPSVTPSISASKSITPTNSPSRSISPSNSPSRSSSPSASPSRSPSRSVSPSASVTPSISIAPSMPPTPSSTPSVTPSPAPSTSSTPSTSPSGTPSRTPSASPSVTPIPVPSTSSTPSTSPSATPSPVPSTSPTSSPSIGASSSPTSSTTPTRSSSPSASPSQSPSPSNSASPVPPSTSSSPGASISPSPSPSSSPGASISPSPSPSSSPVVVSVSTSSTPNSSPGSVSTSSSPSPALITPTTSSSASSSPQVAGHSNKSKKNLSVLIGGIVGGAVAAALLVGALLFFVKRRKPRETNLPELGNTEMMSYSVIPVPPGHDPSNYAIMSTQLSRQQSFNSYSSFDKKQNPADMRESWVINYSDIKIIKKLGVGAHGEVWEGKWKGIQVAVKKLITIDDTDTSDFLAEAALMKKMRPHPNVVLYLGVCREPLCLVTEFVANGNLLTLIRKEPINDEMKLKICQGVAAGMLYLHEQGVLHRDLAARNILLDGLNNPKVCDFGMSRVATDDSAHKTSANVGPIRWMAPEALAERVSSPKTDVWSFGVVVYEILTRKLPYSKVGLPQVGAQVAMGKISLLEDFQEEVGEFSPILITVMKACLQHAPSDRPDFSRIVEMLDVVEVEQALPEAN